MMILVGQCIGQPDKCKILCMACALDSSAVAFAAELQFVWGPHAEGLQKLTLMLLCLYIAIVSTIFCNMKQCFLCVTVCGCVQMSLTLHMAEVRLHQFHILRPTKTVYMSMPDTDG